MLGAAVVSADLPRKTVVTDAGVAVSYDKLVAAACAARGLAPHCILMESHVMSRLWTPAIAERYESLFASEGVVFHKNAKVSRIERSAATGGAEAVALES